MKMHKDCTSFREALEFFQHLTHDYMSIERKSNPSDYPGRFIWVNNETVLALQICAMNWKGVRIQYDLETTLLESLAQHQRAYGASLAAELDPKSIFRSRAPNLASRLHDYQVSTWRVFCVHIGATRDGNSFSKKFFNDFEETVFIIWFNSSINFTITLLEIRIDNTKLRD